MTERLSRETLAAPAPRYLETFYMRRGLFVLVSLVASSLLAFAQAPAPAQFGGDEASSAWTAVVSDDIRRAEYVFHALTAEPAVVSAPNRSHELRSRVSSAGIEVFPRAASADGVGAEWKLTLRSVSFGRLGELRELGAASIASHGARVELDHGLLTEWFVNDERGIEQGWTIPERPRGVEPVWIGLSFGGDLSLRIEDGGRSGVLVDACGEATLRYRDLVVFDATGRELEARILPSPLGVGIRIDDTNAVYPVTVDPLLTGPSWSAESNQVQARMGWSVASAGDVNGDGFSDVIVGAYSYDNGEVDEGRAFVYLGSASGLAASAAWTAESDQALAEFGASVSSAGDVNGDGYSDVIVGAYRYSNGQSGEGRAFVYLGSTTGLGATVAWTAESDQASAGFGFSVATAGDVNGDGFSDVMVGAFEHDNGETDEGRAYVYLGSATGLSATAAWTAESDLAYANFGVSVATAGDLNGDGYSDVIVGAYRYSNGQSGEGRAFVYLGSTTGLGATVAWTAESDQAIAGFGWSVATAGDVNGDGFSDVIVGAPFYSHSWPDEGRAYVYLGSSTGLATSPVWTAESDQTETFFGITAATAGDVNGDGFSDVIVGAPFYSNGQSLEGRAFVYLGSISGPSPDADWTAESDQGGVQLGCSVATAGDVDGDGFSDVIIGAWSFTNGEIQEGRAFVYSGSALGLAPSSSSSIASTWASSRFGISVAAAGDVNGDGYGDVVVGANYFDNGQPAEGRAFVYFGTASGLAPSAAWTAESDQALAFFGVSAGTAGDVNGDGYDDVIVGAFEYDNGETDEGRAFVYLGGASGLSASASWTAEADQAGARFGFSVAAAGDVNGDGFADVVVSAHEFDGDLSGEGRAFVYLGSAAGLSAAPAWSAEGDQTDAEFGTSAATAGDVNADGFSDVIIGAVNFDNGETNEGRVFVYLGSTTGLGSSAAWTAESNQGSALFGRGSGSAGDVNGDGYSDVIVGARWYDDGQTNEGRAFVYLGSASGLAPSAAWTAESNQALAEFGASVSSAGDVNGDGYSDVIVGATRHDNGQTDEGRAYVYLGSASGLSASPAWTAEGNLAAAWFGFSVAGAGDVNGDGYGDVIVGAPDYDAKGRVFVYCGNEGRGGWTLARQQRRASDAAPIALLGRSSDKHEFRIKLGLERELAGFSWASGVTPTARLEWEVAPLRAALDGSRIEQGVAQTITGSPLTFNQLVAFVSTADSVLPFGIGHHVAAGSYHWRARVRTNNPLFPVTPWTTIPWNNVTEAKLRVGPLPATRIAR